ncbi:flavin-containing monooxygenase [Candidatus Uabimicrobium amorphum]|uniref:Flavin-binding monooxygenase n=1 Tax=Uabimicrobium amorphum TaxID=2596890 RepID=A0A5S9F8I4_UABAM|nr:NAD(P)-binding domain-containing protein [Candidatus Uabimicrobium amorphum]BBM88302.1 flavin-binding monooxygenase [Candidatus Uabimicrobium amorphum]
MTREKYAIIGAGPAGLSGARNLQKKNIPFDGFELHSDVGGLWDIDNPNSTMYKSAHLISSKKMTEFAEYPMKEHVADYPHHSEMKQYFRDFAKHFSLYDHYKFQTKVTKLEPVEDGWSVTYQQQDQPEQTSVYKGVILANGIFSKPNMPKYQGEFSGRIMHSSEFKDPSVFHGKRVLIVGAGNTGCDVAVDAVHHATKVDMSVRRGYHFVPKYVFGKPADSVGGKIKLPRLFKQKLDGVLLKFFTGDPEKFGFPKPDHKLYEVHPIVNSMVLYHLGHGDLSVKGDIEKFAGNTVHFKDGTQQDYDIVLFATGYKLNYPFIDKEHLNWQGHTPNLYLNVFHPKYDNLFVLGMIEATGIGWEGRNKQAELVACFIKAIEEQKSCVKKIQKKKENGLTDMRGGYNYMELERMAYYVHKDTYLKGINKHIAQLQ